MPTLQSATVRSRVWQDENGYHIVDSHNVGDQTGSGIQRALNAIDAAPAFGSVHPIRSELFVRNKQLSTRPRSTNEFTVDVEYAELPNTDEADEKTATDGTILRRELDARLGEKRVDKDNLSADIQDSSLLVRSVAIEQAELIYRFSRVVTSLTVAKANGLSLLNTVNNDVFLGDPVRTWRTISMRAHVIQGRTDGRAREEWELAYRSGTWDFQQKFYWNGILLAINPVRVYPETAFSTYGL